MSAALSDMFYGSDYDRFFVVMANEVMDHVASNETTLPTPEEQQQAFARARCTRLGYPIESDGKDGTGSYWEGNGRHQALYDKYWDTYVPDRGAPQASAPKSAFYVYALAKIEHEWYNNGFGNALEGFEGKGVHKTAEFGWAWPTMLAFLHSVSPMAGRIMEDCIQLADMEAEKIYLDMLKWDDM